MEFGVLGRQQKVSEAGVEKAAGTWQDVGAAEGGRMVEGGD